MKKDVYKGKRISVLGLSRSGVAASELAARAGARVFATELNPSTGADVDRLRSLGVEVELGAHGDSVYDSDLVIIAIGGQANPLLTKSLPGLELNKWGNIIADENGRTSLERVWAGGDIVTGSATVIEAMGAGKKAAADIHNYLNANKDQKDLLWKVSHSIEVQP